MKDLLNNGAIIRFDYKENRNDWIDSAEIYVCIAGMGIKNVVIVKVQSRFEYDLENIDDAIDFFKSEVFNEKNLCYKRHQALLELSKENLYYDLENEDDFEKFESIRTYLIEKDNC